MSFSCECFVLSGECLWVGLISSRGVLPIVACVSQVSGGHDAESGRRKLQLFQFLPSTYCLKRKRCIPPHNVKTVSTFIKQKQFHGMRWMGNWACIWQKEDACHFGGKTRRKGPLGRAVCGWEVGIKISQRNKISKGYTGLTSITTVKSGVSIEHNEPSHSSKGGKLLA